METGYNAFIYENENSICETFVDEIAELLDAEILVDNCKYALMYNSKFSKIKTFIQNEISKMIDEYIIHLRNSFASTKLRKHLCRILTDDNTEISNFKYDVHTCNNLDNTTSSENVFEIGNVRCYDKQHTHEKKILHFMWILNDYDGIIVFPNKHTIHPKKGKLIIYPASWCFPLENICVSNLIGLQSYIYDTSKYLL
jgi:hypothetical protein